MLLPLPSRSLAEVSISAVVLTEGALGGQKKRGGESRWERYPLIWSETTCGWERARRERQAEGNVRELTPFFDLAAFVPDGPRPPSLTATASTGSWTPVAPTSGPGAGLGAGSLSGQGRQAYINDANE